MRMSRCVGWPRRSCGPEGDRVVAVEVAEDPAAGLVRAVQPLALAAPRERVALPGITVDVRAAPERSFVGVVEGGAVGIRRDLPSVRHAAGGQADRRLLRPRLRNRLQPAVLPECGRNDRVQPRIGREHLGRGRHREGVLVRATLRSRRRPNCRTSSTTTPAAVSAASPTTAAPTFQPTTASRLAEEHQHPVAASRRVQLRVDLGRCGPVPACPSGVRGLGRCTEDPRACRRAGRSTRSRGRPHRGRARRGGLPR